MLGICALLPGAATAQQITNPPGATEGDQYFEEVPNGGGSSGVNRAGGGGGGDDSGGQPVQATEALEQLGPEGKDAAALANANRPPQVKLDDPRPGPASETGSPTDGDGGMGFWFPLLLAGTAVAAIAYGLRRRLYPA
jgi:hypothetical protein